MPQAHRRQLASTDRGRLRSHFWRCVQQCKCLPSHRPLCHIFAHTMPWSVASRRVVIRPMVSDDTLPMIAQMAEKIDTTAGALQTTLWMRCLDTPKTGSTLPVPAHHRPQDKHQTLIRDRKWHEAHGLHVRNMMMRLDMRPPPWVQEGCRKSVERVSERVCAPHNCKS